MKLSRILSMAAATFLLGNTSLYGQFHLGKDKDKDKSEIFREKQQKRDEKNVRTYDKIKAYSHEKYDTDPDFRDEVDDAYRDLLRDHMRVAYEHNLARGSHIRAIHEDRFREHTGLYDNLLVQDEINRLGQRLVPVGSDRVFAFRLLPDPTPSAYTLATGTIYISTGMVSILDSQAQLAYVLAHEMAHVQLDHWKELVMMQQGLEAYNVDQGKKTERVAVLAGLAGALAGGLGTKSAAGAVGGGVGGVLVGAIAGSLVNRPAVVSWDRAQEDEADKMAFKVLLDSRYDVREIPKLYNAMEALSSRDTRMTLGFLGERSRVHERKENAEKLIQESYKAEIAASLKKGLVGDTASHRNLMAELKRDNGIMAYYYDMFELALKNLSEAVAIRDNDPEAQYFYGKTLETVGRTDEDYKLAIQCFQKAAQYDVRQQNFGSHLHYALALLENDKNRDQKQITTELDNYIAAWFRYLPEVRKAEFLPPSLDSIDDYMAIYSPIEWRAKLPSEVESIKVDFNAPPRSYDPVAALPGAPSTLQSVPKSAASRPAPAKSILKNPITNR